MLIDDITIKVKAGDGGDGAERRLLWASTLSNIFHRT